jgi:hypothetical protein
MTRTLGSAIWTQIDSDAPHNEIDGAIFQAPDQIPFALVNELARKVCRAPTTVYRHLIKSLHFVFKHLKWIPHDLTLAEEVILVEESNEVLQFVKSVRHNGPTLPVTLDECWSYLRQDFERQRLPRDEPLADQVRSLVSSLKGMSTIVWNTRGFHAVDVILKAVTFDTDYHIENILFEILRHIPDARIAD